MAGLLEYVVGHLQCAAVLEVQPKAAALVVSAQQLTAVSGLRYTTAARCFQLTLDGGVCIVEACRLPQLYNCGRTL
jgi:hypothetical protein